MANEATCIEAPRQIKRYLVSDGEAIPKGTILRLSTVDFYAEPSRATDGGGIFAGIAVEEKTASDGVTEIGAAIDGTWDIVNSTPTLSIGNMVVLSSANTIRLALEADFPLGKVFGKVLEGASAAEKVRVRVGLN